VFRHVGQRFLGDTEERHLDRRTERQLDARDLHLHRDALVLRPSLGQSSESIGKLRSAEFLGSERPYRPPSLGQAAAREPKRHRHMALRLALNVRGTLRGLKLRDDAG